MRHIPRIDLDGCKVLTPLEMNKIHIETGLHTPVAPGQPPAASADSTPVKPH